MIEIYYLNKQFNIEAIKNNFQSYFDENCESQQFCKHLRHFSRNFQLNQEQLNHILLKLSENVLLLENKIILSQVVKYSLRNGQYIRVSSLNDILNLNDNKNLQAEILQGLAYQIELQQYQKMESSEKEQIKKIVEKKEFDEGKKFLIKQLIKIPEKKPKKFDVLSEINHSEDLQFKLKLARTRETQLQSQTHVISQRQSIKGVQKFSIRAITFNQTFSQMQSLEKLPELIQNVGGCDKSWFDSQYQSIQILYKKVVSNQDLLKDQDQKFLIEVLRNKSKNYQNDLQILIGSRIIIQIFLHLSKRTNQNRQKIFTDAYEQIIQFCSNQKNVINLLYNKQEEKIYQSIQKNRVEKDKPNDIEKEALVQSRVDQPQEFLKKQIDKLRCEAIQTIINLIQIQKAEINSNNLLVKLIENIKDQSDEFKTYSFQLYTLLESRFQYFDVFRNCFPNLVNQNKIIEGYCFETLREYAKDKQKCIVLFKENEIRELCSYIIKQEQGKLNKCQLLQICLENNSIIGLDETNINQLIDEIFKSKEYSIKLQIIKIILYISKLNPNIISKNSANKLATRINEFDGQDKTFRYIIIILGIISQIQKIESFDTLSQHLLNDDKLEDDYIQIQFENSLIDIITVQFIVCQIMLTCQSIVSKLVIQNLLIALENEQTTDNIRLLLARIMLNVDNLYLDQEKLKEKIFVFIQDHSPELAYYLSIVYTNQLTKIQKDEIIADFEMLSKCQVISNQQTIQDQTCQITLNNFDILQNQINILQEINSGQANVIKFFLQRNDNNLEIKVINSLLEFSKKNILIPKSIIETIGDLSNNQEIWINLIKQIIDNGQSVTQIILEKFVNFLYFKEEFSNSAFQILDQANLNQDLPDEIFIPLEIERAAYSIQNEPFVKENAIKYLLIEVQKGNKLTKNTFKSLKTELENESVLDILIQISKTNQIIPNYLVEKMIQMFNPNLAQIKLINIFKYISKNNQEIIPEIIGKLEKALDNNEVKDEAFLFFASYGQRNQQLSRNIIKKIYDRLQSSPTQELKFELLNTLVFQIDKIQQDPIAIDMIRSEIIQCLQKEDLNLLLIEGLIKIKQKGFMNEQLIDLLIIKMQTQTYSQELMLKMQNIIPQNINLLNEKQKDTLNLLKINQLNSKDFFKKIQALKNKSLLPQNFEKLKELLQENPDNITNIISILGENQKDIPQDLLEMIIFQSNTLDEILYEDFKSFIQNVIQNQIKFTDNALQSLSNSRDQEFSRKAILNILQYQPCSDFSKKFYKVIKQLGVNELEEQIQNDLNLNQKIIIKYSNFILQNKYKNLELTVKSLFNKRNQINSNINDNSILKCLSFIYQSKNIILNQEILAYFYENMLNQNNDSITRSLSFRGLQSAIQIEFDCNQFKDCQVYLQNNDVSNQTLVEFLTYCTSRVKTMEEQLKIKLELDFHQIEILLLIPKLDTKINMNNFENFTIELLQLNLFDKFSSTKKEEQIFYNILNNLDQKLQNQLKQILQLLLYQEKFVKFQQILDLLKFIKDLEEQVIFQIFYLKKNPYSKFKYKWVEKQLQIKYGQNILTKTLKNIAKLPVCQIEYFIKNEGSWNDFNRLIQFIENYNLFDYNLFLQDQNTTHQKILRQYEKYVLIQYIKQINQIQKINRIMTILIEQFGWKFEDLEKIFNTGLKVNDMDQDNKQESFISVLQILQNFNITPNDHLQYQDIFSQPINSWQTQAYKCCLQKRFPQSTNQMKDLQQLLEEFFDKEDKKTQDNLLETIQKIKQSSFKSQILPKYENINNWKIEQIQEWAKKVRMNKQYFQNYQVILIEAIAVIKIAITRQFSFELANNQLMSAFLALFEQKGTLLQVSTGEGKSIIICMIAIIKALEGKKVDIITSSPVLAQRDVIENEKLYQIFQLTCSSNIDHSFQNTGQKKCYDCDIVYGDVSQFQFDYLRDNYLKMQTLRGRSQDFVIVDEVDSMLIDESSKIARLSSQISGLDLFKPIYIKLWQLFQIYQRQIIKIAGDYYFFLGTIGYQGDLITLDYIGEDNIEHHIPDLKQYIDQKQDLTNIGRLINEDVSNFIRQSLKQEIEVYICELKIPQYLQSIIQIQLPKWINNLFIAIEYQEKIQYVVYKGMIKPVDYLSTGLILDSTNWQDGLHQFLQIKHGLRLTSESFTTNFLSNIGYFKKYGSNIIGLSGTIGSDHAQTVLKNTYKVCIKKIPDMTKKKFVEYPTAILNNEYEQIQNICNSAIDETKNGRAVLIISETINFTEKIYQNLLKIYESRLLKLYHMNNMNLEQKIQNISKGEIIVATNLAGRGTDIKADSIQNEGGIHVILTFLPQNQRVEEQAFGRTSRKGQKGTGQMILNKMNIPFKNNSNTKLLKKLRDERESEILDKFIQSQMKIIEIKDELFMIFNKDFNDYRQKLKKQKNSHTFIQNSLLDIEEEWATLLNQIDNHQINKDFAMQEYQNFQESILSRFSSSTFEIKNPFNYISIGNEQLIKCKNFALINKKCGSEAKKYFELAIQLEQENCQAAYFGLGFLEIWNNKLKAKQYFRKAKELSQREIKMLQQLTDYFIVLNLDTNNDLFKQLFQQINILGTFCQNLKNNIKQIEKSERLIHITKIQKNYSSHVLYQKTFYNKMKIENAEEKLKQDKNNEYELMFRNLTESFDLFSTDQTIEIIKKYKNDLDNQQEQDFLIESQKVSLIKIQSFSKQLDMTPYKINLQFKNLNYLQFLTISSSITARTIDITTKIKFSEIIIPLRSHSFIDQIEVSYQEDGALITVGIFKDSMKQFMDQNSLQTISIRKLDLENAKSFIAQLPNSLLFNFKFNDVILEGTEIVKDFNIKVEFIELNYNNSISLIKFLRSQKIELNLKLKRLNQAQFMSLLNKIKLNQNQMEIKETKFFNQFYLYNDIPIQELNELEMRGLFFIIQLNEQSPIKWKSITLSLGICFVSMGFGSALAYIGEAQTGWALFKFGFEQFNNITMPLLLNQNRKKFLNLFCDRHQIVNQQNYGKTIQNYELLSQYDFNQLKPFISENIINKFTKKLQDKSICELSLFHIIRQVNAYERIIVNNQIISSIFKQLSQEVDTNDQKFLENWESITNSLTNMLLQKFDDAINYKSLTLIIQSEVNKNEKIQGLIEKIIETLTLKLGRYMSKCLGFQQIIQSLGFDSQTALIMYKTFLNLNVVKLYQINKQINIEVIDPQILIDEVNSNIKLNLSKELNYCQDKLIKLLNKINEYLSEFNILLFESKIKEIAYTMTEKIIIILETLDIKPNQQYLKELSEKQNDFNFQINFGSAEDENDLIGYNV
ncbi:unnamed protein product [Paramecium sonneborni]|uniref:Protein translocase subunit SecA n=1 Tax=Paramecium sonneborni TaxID=65129 RepID=A0A8S1Q2R2_9CILI|nr:unnamed protein product [Paramecium sonneborni]